VFVAAISYYYHVLSLDVAARWLTRLVHIQEVCDSDTTLETDYRKLGFCGFPQSFQADAGIAV
jgi:hypothetical protein